MQIEQKIYKNCQSCGMPSKRDPLGGGTNKDGSTSVLYCSYCYMNGVFTNPDIKTASDMQAFVKNKLKEMGFSEFVACFFAIKIPKLERWANT